MEPLQGGTNSRIRGDEEQQANVEIADCHVQERGQGSKQADIRSSARPNGHHNPQAELREEAEGLVDLHDGATGGVDLLDKEFGLTTALVTGPATDNEVGRNIIKNRLNVNAINAITNATELGDAVADYLQLDKS